MIRRKQEGGLLLDAKYRTDGEAEINGRHVEWSAGYVLTYVPFESTQVTKRIVDPDMAENVEKALESVHWGALIALELKGKNVVNVAVEADPLADME